MRIACFLTVLLLAAFPALSQTNPPTCASGSPHCVQLNATASVTPATTGYNFYRETTSGACTQATTGAALAGTGCTKLTTTPVATPAYLDNSTSTNTLTEGATYFYVSTAVDPAGESGPSNEASAKIPVTTVPQPDTNLTATPSK